MLVAKTLADTLASTRDLGRVLLPEEVAFAVAGEIGLRVPRFITVTDPAEVRRFSEIDAILPERLVVKLRTSKEAHKTDLGGVTPCPRQAAALEATMRQMARDVGDRVPIDGFSIHEYVDHDTTLGGELLLGARWTDDFGPIAALGLGGLEVERLARSGSLAPLLVSSAAGSGLPASHPLIDFLTRPHRGQPARWRRHELEELITRVLAFAEKWMAPDAEDRVDEFEVNPMVRTRRYGPVALDAHLRRAVDEVRVAAPRPLERLHRLLEPNAIAVAGVSRRLNVGHVILRNIARQGFDRERLWVVKEGGGEIDGCRCYDSFADLPEPVDLAVLAVDAARLPEMVSEIVEGRRARSLILIPGGVGERAGSEDLAASILETIQRARRRGDGPLINGGNCLGVRSEPGRYDTLFIPEHKLAFHGIPAPLALVSQSGAFAIARASRLAALAPRYVVTLGNQLDLTLGDYLTYLEGDPEVSIFACYVEGFRPLDGRRFLDSVRRLAAAGRVVVLYRAGRTSEGARAAASHTASVAGSYRVTTELARRAGALVAETIEDFEDLTAIFSRLDGRRPRGRRLGAMSNAGFEVVAMGDHLLGLELARLEPDTESRLAEILAARRVDAIVAPNNPLDVTPMLDDEAFGAAARALLDDPGVDLGVVGCVPLTAALTTLPAGEDHDEDLSAPAAVAGRLIELWNESTKPWVAVVDGGELYDPLARTLDRAGLPVFRSADRALAALAAWTRFRLAVPPRAAAERERAGKKSRLRSDEIAGLR